MRKNIFRTLGLESDAAPENQYATLSDLSEEQIREIAKQAHENVRSGPDSLSWDDSSEQIQASAIDGVKSILKDPSMTPEKSHINWMKYKEAQGWVFGDSKDEEAKTHPCMVPYNELPEHERIKDDMFVDTVKNELLQLCGPESINGAPSPVNPEVQQQVEQTEAAIETLENVAGILDTSKPDSMNGTNAQLVCAMLSTAVGPTDAVNSVPSAGAFAIGNRSTLVAFTKEGIQSKLKTQQDKLFVLKRRAALPTW